MKPFVINPESEDDPAHTTILQASNEEKNVSQIGILIQVLKETKDMCVFESEVGTALDIDQAAREDASKTYVAAGLQLRNLIDDQARWTLTRNDMDTKVVAILDLKAKEQSTRIRANERMSAPHVLLKPNFRVFQMPPDGRNVWFCWLGGVDPMKNDVHGSGPTPVAAAAAFDVCYMKSIQPPPKAPPLVVEKPARPTRKPKKT